MKIPPSTLFAWPKSDRPTPPLPRRRSACGATASCACVVCGVRRARPGARAARGGGPTHLGGSPTPLWHLLLTPLAPGRAHTGARGVRPRARHFKRAGARRVRAALSRAARRLRTPSACVGPVARRGARRGASERFGRVGCGTPPSGAWPRARGPPASPPPAGRRGRALCPPSPPSRLPASAAAWRAARRHHSGLRPSREASGNPANPVPPTVTGWLVQALTLETARPRCGGGSTMPYKE